MEQVKHEVILNVRKYLKEHLPGYEIVEVRKKSWYEEDRWNACFTGSC